MEESHPTAAMKAHLKTITSAKRREIEMQSGCKRKIDAVKFQIQ
jgi:hypothetical protein